LSATSECYRPEDLELWVMDSGSSLQCGPFASGDVVRISKAPAGGSPGSRPGQSCVAAMIEVVGQARVMAVDPLGQVSTVVGCP